MQRKAIYLPVLMIILFLNGGCGKTIRELYVRENVDLGFVSRIAVLPLENNSKDLYVAERVRNSVTTQILSRKLFDVIDKGILDNALQEEALQPGAPIDLNSLKRLAQRLNVQGFILGSVDECTEVRSGSYSYPIISITLRLVDVNGAVVLWQSTGHRSGDSAMIRLFGLGSVDAFYNTDKLVKGMVRSIPKR